ncbi:zf-HC2 domain-containing protein [Mariniblastus fucicola]|nr:zf-HC2 domain-containing protein [Mariniblastus fucicola]
MNLSNQTCEDFEPLVSAMIDGELSASELLLVNGHLEGCESCRRLRAEFVTLDASISLQTLAGEERENTLTETFVVTRQKQSIRNWMSVWRLIPLAGVAALMIGLFLVTTHSAPQATAEQLTPEQFVKPMTDLNRINHQQQRDQELMLRTLGMDLRSLKLELKQLENTGPEDRTRFENQIEAMLKRVEQFEDQQ